MFRHILAEGTLRYFRVNFYALEPCILFLEEPGYFLKAVV